MTSTVLGSILLLSVLGGAFYLSRRHSQLRAERAQFIRAYRFPAGLPFKLNQAYPTLTGEQTELILDGLRAWFLLIAENPRTRFGMPSKAVDTAWHEFILMTHSYSAFCEKAFGKFLHHVPHDGNAKAEADGLAMTYGTRSGWFGSGALAAGMAGGLAAGAIASPKDLFGIDQKLGITDGNSYSADDFERMHQRHSQLTSTGGGDGGSGGSGDASSCGDSGGGCGDGGGGGGCGGGGCGS
ncbi:MAG: hypothetical protein JNL19_15520 [Burkholderiales bacterium]|nr:hypothetical protein [Burkholderiales bacterium]